MASLTSGMILEDAKLENSLPSSSAGIFYNRRRSIDRNIHEPQGWLARLGAHRYVELTFDHFADQSYLLEYSSRRLKEIGHEETAALLTKTSPEVADRYSPPADCMRLPVEDEAVVWVGEAAELARALEDLRAAECLGFDCESGWVGDQSRATLLQISHRTRCYLFDLLALGHTQQFSRWLENLFCSDTLKLGFSCKGDLNLLGISHLPVRYVVDLQPLWEPNKKTSLRDVVNAVVGLPLCKREQCSNWSRRPLRKSQLHYAALDSWCLLAVAEHLQKNKMLNLRGDWEEKHAKVKQQQLQHQQVASQQDAEKRARTREFIDSLLDRCRRSMSARGVLKDHTSLRLVCKETGQDKYSATLLLDDQVLQESLQRTADGSQASALKAQLAEERRLALKPFEREQLLQDGVNKMSSVLASGKSDKRTFQIHAQSASEQLQSLRCELERERQLEVWANLYELEIVSDSFPLRFACRGGYAVIKGHDPKLPAFPVGTARGDVLLRVGSRPLADVDDTAGILAAVAELPRPLMLTFGRMRSELSLLS